MESSDKKHFLKMLSMRIHFSKM